MPVLGVSECIADEMSVKMSPNEIFSRRKRSTHASFDELKIHGMVPPTRTACLAIEMLGKTSLSGE